MYALPPKKEEDMSPKELREHKRKEKAQARADRLEQEAKEKALFKMTEIQNGLVDEAECNIKNIKSKINDIKQEYFEDNYDDTSYALILNLHRFYKKLATAKHILQMIRKYPFNEYSFIKQNDSFTEDKSIWDPLTDLEGMLK